SATESGNTATVTTTAAHNLAVGDTIQVTGVNIFGYNGTFTVLSVPTTTTFTYTTVSGLGVGTGGNAFRGSIYFSSLSRTGFNLSKAGAGTLTFNGNATYTGSTVIQNGQVLLNGFTGGTGGRLSATTDILVNGSATLALDNAAGLLDRINNSAPVTLR